MKLLKRGGINRHITLGLPVEEGEMVGSPSPAGERSRSSGVEGSVALAAPLYLVGEVLLWRRQ